VRARALIPLLFLSGAAALVLEVAWFRRTAQVAGGTAVAMAAVLAAVIGGMAAGSFLLGRTADRVRSPVRLYGILEAGVALGAILTPWLLSASESLFVGIERHLGGLLATPARFLLATLLLAGPAVLMGGTLPAVAAALRAAPDDRGRGIGALYGANTLGAVAGTVAAGFLLIPALGLAWTTRSAAVLSGLAAAGALLLTRRGSDARLETRVVTPAGALSADARRAIVLYAVSGFLGLVAEVAFARSLVLVFGSTTYAFSTMLAVFLLGIGAGSLLGSALARSGRCRRRLETTLALTAALFSLSALVVYELPRLYLELYLRLGADFEAGIVLRLLLSALVLLPGSLGLGAAFPLAAHLAAGGRGVGEGTGKLYAANTVASIAGSTLAVFALVPLLGPQHAVASVAILAAAVALVSGRRAALAALLLVAAVGLKPPSEQARERLLAGVFFNPWAFLTARADAIDEETWDLGVDIPRSWHGTDATVAIWRWAGSDCLLIDGKAVASDQVLADDHHLKLLGHLPMLVHPDPQDVLVVGLGMGTTYEAVAAHRPARITVVEIEGTVVEAAAWRGIRPEDVRIADARTHLRATSRRYDVVTSDPIHPWVRGGGDLYTREYFEACRARLRPGGVVCQWLPAYQMGFEDVRDVVRTFTSVFRSAAYFSTQDLVLVGVATGEVPDPRPFAADRVEPVLEPDLSSLRIAGHDRLAAAAGDGPVLTDDALRLEFSTPRHLESPEVRRIYEWIRAMWRDPPPPYDDLLAAEILWRGGHGMEAQELFEAALRSRPAHAYAKRYVGEVYRQRAEYFSRTDEPGQARYYMQRARRLLGSDARLDLTLAEDRIRRGDHRTARKILLRLLRATPDSKPLRRLLARLE
jgi:spermidine synthase